MYKTLINSQAELDSTLKEFHKGEYRTYLMGNCELGVFPCLMIYSTHDNKTCMYIDYTLVTAKDLGL